MLRVAAAMRRSSSVRASSRRTIIWLKAVASSPTSSLVRTGTVSHGPLGPGEDGARDRGPEALRVAPARRAGPRHHRAVALDQVGVARGAELHVRDLLAPPATRRA